MLQFKSQANFASFTVDLGFFIKNFLILSPSFLPKISNLYLSKIYLSKLYTVRKLSSSSFCRYKLHFYIREKMARWEKGDKQSPYSKNMLCTIAHFAKLCSSFTKSMPAYVHDKGKNFPLIFYMHFLRRNC